MLQDPEAVAQAAAEVLGADPDEVSADCDVSTSDSKDMLCKVSFPETTEIPEDFSEQVAEKLKDNLGTSDGDITVQLASTS